MNLNEYVPALGGLSDIVCHNSPFAYISTSKLSALGLVAEAITLEAAKSNEALMIRSTVFAIAFLLLELTGRFGRLKIVLLNAYALNPLPHQGV